MDAFTNFLANNYIWFLIISLILIFALIGYLVDLKEAKTGKRIRPKKEETKVIDFTSVEQGKSLNQSLKSESNSNLDLDSYSKQASTTIDPVEAIKADVKPLKQEEINSFKPEVKENELSSISLEPVNMNTGEEKMENKFDKNK